MRTACLLVALFLSPPPLQSGTGALLPAATHPFELDEDASGRFDTGALAVFGYSADAPDEDDPQVYAYLKPDLVLGSWFADRGDETEPDGYNQDFRAFSQAAHVLFMAGLNVSAIYPDQAPDTKTFNDWATRDLAGRLVEHPEVKQPRYLASLRTAPAGRGDTGGAKLQPPRMHRASLADPRFRARVLKRMEAQIDLGADGIVLAESDALGYRGNAEKGYNGDEGYDRYFLADFNRYLLDKFPDYNEAHWEVLYQMRLDNTVNPWFAWDDLRNNFNYRRYLDTKRWTQDPRNRAGLPDRPLVAEWGDLPYPPGEAPRLGSGFLAKDLAFIQKQMILKLRRYARSAQHREILVAAEGMLPDVDLNEYPLRRVNRDDGDEPVDYLPVTWNGSLKGSVSLLKAFKTLKARSRRVSGPALLVLHLGLGEEDYAARYNRLSAEEKRDYWRIYVPEAYACGAFFAFHLRESLGQQPSSIQAGIIDDLVRDAAFYKKNRGLFTGAEDAGRGVRCDDAKVACNVTEQPLWRRSVLHLINHHYIYELTPVEGLTVSVASAVAPAVAYLRSPDSEGSTPVAFRYQDGQVTLSIPKLSTYNVVVLKWPVDGPLQRGAPAPILTPPPAFAPPPQSAVPTPTAAPSPLPAALALPATPRPRLPLPAGPSASALPPPLPPSELPPELPRSAEAVPAPAPAAVQAKASNTPLPAPAAAVPTATPCVPGQIRTTKRVWVPALLGDTRDLGVKAALRLGTARGDLKDYVMPFTLTASARVWAETDVEGGFKEDDPQRAPEVFLDDSYLGPILSRHWRSSRALTLDAGPHRLTVRHAGSSEAPTVGLSRLRVLSDELGRWEEVPETKPCGCGGPPCAEGGGPGR